MKYVTGDLHLGHDEIIGYCKRPYPNVKVMDRTITKDHNNIVTDDDDVYIIGDFSLKTAQYRGTLENYVQKLNGRLHLILGNHDIKDAWLYCEIGFWSVHAPYLEVDEFVLAHDPALSQIDRSRPFLCAHVHDLFVLQKNVLNVGVDIWGKPLSLDFVRQYLKDNMEGIGNENSVCNRPSWAQKEV